MKKLMLLTLLISYSVMSIAQNSKKPSYPLKHEIGFNATQLFSNIFTNSTTKESDRFSMLYKRHDKEGKSAFRLGLGLSASTIREDNFNGESTNTSIASKLALGYEFRNQIHDKWTMFYGVDWKFGYTNQNVQFISNFDEVNSSLNVLDFGIAPLFGIEFQVNKHIRFATELSFIVNYTREKFTDNSNAFSQFNESFFPNKEFSARIDSPGFIYMIVRL